MTYVIVNEAERTARTVREIAVELVDAIYGYTCEFNVDPAWHARVYELAEERLCALFTNRDAALREAREEIALYKDALEAARADHVRAQDYYSAARTELDRLRAELAGARAEERERIALDYEREADEYEKTHFPDLEKEYRAHAGRIRARTKGK